MTTTKMITLIPITTTKCVGSGSQNRVSLLFAGPSAAGSAHLKTASEIGCIAREVPTFRIRTFVAVPPKNCLRTRKTAYSLGGDVTPTFKHFRHQRKALFGFAG